jgi:steroid 5-alpha reductase family enzyme
VQLLCRTYFVDKDPISWRPLLVFGLVSIWAIRLSWHIGSRNDGEDWRYVLLRKRFHHPNPLVFKIKIYLFIFILQWVMQSICVIAACNTIKYSVNENVTIYDKIGLALFAFGFIFEVIADIQLNRYIAIKKLAAKEGRKVNRFLQSGLWRYTRHPNYFGETVLWWGIYCFSLNTTGSSISNFFSPLLINFLLRYLSGVPFLEKVHMKEDEFKEYASRTPIFIPGMPGAIKDDKSKTD